MGITPFTLYKYFKELLNKPIIKKCFDGAFRKLGSFRPAFNIVSTCGYRCGGLTWGRDKVEVSSWILKDAQQAKSVVRHEVAHLLHEYFMTGGTPHGKEYMQWLKKVSPRNWRLDRHFSVTPAIQKARKIIHPTKGRPFSNPLIQYRQFRLDKSLT